ncbi:hypothetical protein M2164_000330 [Streptomyces sp. SAI-208]|uniref:8-oxoguanine DNA glycosylase OGG fold protein n=1 Tax=Streptomyces sp. SAI-208 TaxID=2940550 RepID=UPI002474F2FC|nr:hypothetical protein [Streptomyces sp. SAI-208]MDH6604695.1 hypothetical protein [Streptomyces sp. SAI-208]
MGARLLPDAVVQALRHWWKENAPTYSDGTPGAHAVRYTPRRWVQIVPWPPALTLPCAGGDAAISRAEVTGAVADALRREAFREALVATYVWGKGKRGTPGGSGPATLHKILAAGGLDAALATAVTALREHGSREAYAALHRQVPGFGPSFFTKFLYFTGTTLPPAQGPAPLILDRVLARRLRWLAAAVGRESGHAPDGSVASWVWADGNWSPHRYGVYLSFLHAAARQLAASDDWPSDAEPGRESRPPPRCQHGRTPVARGPAATEPLGSRAFCHGARRARVSARALADTSLVSPHPPPRRRARCRPRQHSAYSHRTARSPSAFPPGAPKLLRICMACCVSNTRRSSGSQSRAVW